MDINPVDLDIVVLCGGRGARLRPATDQIPKPLVPVCGRPIIDHIIDFYVRLGYRRFRFCVGYLGEAIRQHITQAVTNLDLTFSDQGLHASMLQRLHALRNYVTESFLVIYGDTFTDLNPALLCRHHRRLGAAVTIVTTQIQSPFGIVEIDERQFVNSFREKPIFNYFIGSFMMQRSVLDSLSECELGLPDGQGLVRLFEYLAASKNLAAFSHDGIKITFNTEAERGQAERELRSFYTLDELSNDA